MNSASPGLSNNSASLRIVALKVFSVEGEVIVSPEVCLCHLSKKLIHIVHCIVFVTCTSVHMLHVVVNSSLLDCFKSLNERLIVFSESLVMVSMSQFMENNSRLEIII
jgi:hypothetical protein